MKKLYKRIIKELYEEFYGVYYITISTSSMTKPEEKYLYLSMMNAARWIFPYFLLWGIFKLWQQAQNGIVYFSWVDAIFFFFLIPQFLAGFTNVIKNEYERINKPCKIEGIAKTTNNSRKTKKHGNLNKRHR